MLFVVVVVLGGGVWDRDEATLSEVVINHWIFQPSDPTCQYVTENFRLGWVLHGYQKEEKFISPK